MFALHMNDTETMQGGLWSIIFVTHCKPKNAGALKKCIKSNVFMWNNDAAADSDITSVHIVVCILKDII